jgi:fluoride exporter
MGLARTADRRLMAPTVQGWRSMRSVIGISIGGALGAAARYGVDGLVSRATRGGFPWGTLLVNVSGAFLLGLTFTVLAERFAVAPWIRSSITIGFLGGYTTFSTLALETVRLIQGGSYVLGLANALGSIVVGLFALLLGIVMGRAI